MEFFSLVCRFCIRFKKTVSGPSKCILLLALINVFCAPISAAPSRGRRSLSSSRPRWQVPCGGSSPQEEVMGDAAVWEAFGGDFIDEFPSMLHLNYRDMAHKATSVKDKVHELRDKMIVERIGSLTLVESLDQGGFSLKGMPDASTIGESQNGDDEMYGHIAALAVFLEQSRIDEDTHEQRKVSYVRHFQEIEEDLYWILCSLQSTMAQPVSQHVTHDVMAVDLRDIPDRMMRRQRDYIILRDSAKVLLHAAYHFSRQASALELKLAPTLR